MSRHHKASVVVRESESPVGAVRGIEDDEFGVLPELDIRLFAFDKFFPLALYDRDMHTEIFVIGEAFSSRWR